MTPERQLNPQTINLYVYVANNPLAYLDPTGMELVRLGQHTDEEIKKRQGEIDAELKKEGITDQQKQALEKERNTLQIEQEGNRIVGDWLRKLESIGEGRGLSLSDFTLSTDPRNDFRSLTRQRGYRGDALERQLDEVANAVAVVFRGQSRQIFVNQTSAIYKPYAAGGTIKYWNVFSTGPSDVAVIGATYLRHEQYHRDRGPSERSAYQEQINLLNRFGPGAFINKNVFNPFRADLRKLARSQ